MLSSTDKISDYCFAMYNIGYGLIVKLYHDYGEKYFMIEENIIEEDGEWTPINTWNTIIHCYSDNGKCKSVSNIRNELIKACKNYINKIV